MKYNFFEHFFTHKDYISQMEQEGMYIPGKLFTPLHFIVSGIILAGIILAIWYVTKKKSEKLLKGIYLGIWITLTSVEVMKMIWESVSGMSVSFETTGILPLYPCSVIMYTLPFTIWGTEKLKNMANGYTCTIGFIGAVINFAYPATALPNYSAISLVGLHAFLYHGAMLFIAITLLTTKQHSYGFAKKWTDLLLPAIPMLIFSIPANIVNYTVPGADYMFFMGDFTFLGVIFKDTPNWVTTILAYLIYIIVPALFYLPGFIKNQKQKGQ